MAAQTEIDRLTIRGKPTGRPLMRQRWIDLLFLHWPIEASVIRPLIPRALDIDQFDGRAWIGITPFHLSELQIFNLPPIPGLSSFHELNVRTYVLHDGVPGVWFFSLDAARLLPAVAARLFYMLPYFNAGIQFARDGGEMRFDLVRPGPRPARFMAQWKAGLRLDDADVHSLAFFLTERYCCYAAAGEQLYQVRIYHRPWMLDEGIVLKWESTMISALGIPEPDSPPLAYHAKYLDVELWAPRKL